MNNYIEINYRTESQVAWLTLNRPEQLNAWTPVMEREIKHALTRASADDQIRSIVITGAGKGFCAGADMARLAGAATLSAPEISPTQENFGQRYSYIAKIDKPVIAAINGAVAGVGLCISLYCDLRYMVEGAKLTTAFARRGLIAEHGIAWILPRLIGPMNALDLLLTGRTITTAEAATMGLVRSLPKEGFTEAVQAIALQLAELSSPRSMRIIKEQVRLGYFQDLASATQLADREQASCANSEDLKEGVSSFVERRKPNFTGR